MTNLQSNEFNVNKDFHDETDRSSYDELLQFSAIAKAMIAESIRDIESNNKTNQADAKNWLYEDNSKLEFSLAWCCDMLNMNMNLLGYSANSAITVDHIRQKVKESSESRKQLLSALVSSRQSLIDDHRDYLDSSALNLDHFFISTEVIHYQY